MTYKIGKPQICWVSWNRSKQVCKPIFPCSLCPCRGEFFAVSFYSINSDSHQTQNSSSPFMFDEKRPIVYFQKDPACPHLFPQGERQLTVHSWGPAASLALEGSIETGDSRSFMAQVQPMQLVLLSPPTSSGPLKPSLLLCLLFLVVQGQKLFVVGRSVREVKLGSCTFHSW